MSICPFQGAFDQKLWEGQACTSEAHAIEDCGVEHEGHGAGVEGLRTEGPHVGAVHEVELCRHHRCARLVLLQYLLLQYGGQPWSGRKKNSLIAEALPIAASKL